MNATTLFSQINITYIKSHPFIYIFFIDFRKCTAQSRLAQEAGILCIKLKTIFWGWGRSEEAVAAITARASWKTIWKTKWVIDDRSQLSPCGSDRGGSAGRASHTTHLRLPINKRRHQPSQTGKHWTLSTWQGALTLSLPPHALTVVKSHLYLLPCRHSIKSNVLKETVFPNSLWLKLDRKQSFICQTITFVNVFSTACGRKQYFNNSCILLCKRADFSCSNGLKRFALTKRLCYSAKRTCAEGTKLMWQGSVSWQMGTKPRYVGTFTKCIYALQYNFLGITALYFSG